VTNKYDSKENDNLEFHDFPGYGTYASIGEYFSRNVVLSNACDVYVLVYKDRLRYRDIEIIKHVKLKLSRPFLLVKSFIDQAAKQPKKTINQNVNVSSYETYKQLKKIANAEKNHSNFDKLFDNQHFKLEDLNVDFVCCTNEQSKLAGEFVKFNEILNRIVEICPSVKLKNELLEFCLKQSRELISRKRNEMKKGIKKASFISGLSDLVPLAGTIANMGILVEEIRKYRICFGLNQECINELLNYESVRGVGYEQKINSIKEKYANLVNYSSSLVNQHSLALGSIATGLAINAALLAVGISTFGLSCVLSAAVTGPISYYLARSVLTKALSEMQNDSLDIVNMIEEIQKKKKTENKP
jgi:siroheme synthase (precorrin-2 oxidase/ferrochelatase)